MTERTPFEAAGYKVMDDFLQPGDCEEILGFINRFREGHEVPEIYRPMKDRSLRYFVIDGDRIKAHLPKIWNFYLSQMLNHVNEITSMELAPLANTRVGVNVNIMPPNGSEYRWHYDRTTLTAILYLNHVEGGETELYPNYRLLLKNRDRIRVQRVLDKAILLSPVRNLFAKKVVITPHPGRLAIMLGNRCWHSVRPVEGDSDRINIILAYDMPGAKFPMEKDLDTYLYTQEKSTSPDPNYAQ